MVTKEKWEEYVATCRKVIAEMTEDGKNELEMAVCHLLANEHPETGEKFSTPDMLTYVTKFVADTTEEIVIIKNKFAFLMQTMAMASNAEASIFVSEVWMSPQQPEKDEQSDPADHPDKSEAFMIIAVHREHGITNEIGFLEGTTGADRHITEWNSGEMSSRFNGMISDDEPSEIMREAARGAAKVMASQVGLEQICGNDALDGIPPGTLPN